MKTRAPITCSRKTRIAFSTILCLALAGSACGEAADESFKSIEQYECGSSTLYADLHEGCSAMDAAGDGACFCLLGFAWNGSACVGVNGCECQGPDCDKLSQSLEQCQAAHSSCSAL